MRIFTLKFKRTLLLLTIFFASAQLIHAQVPIINSFNPTSECTGTSGLVDTIFGSNLLNAFSVQFNGVSGTILYNRADTIIVKIPDGITTGLISVTTFNGTGYDTIPFMVNPLPTPTIMGATNACNGDSIKLQVTGYIDYNWRNSSTADSIYAFT